MADIEMDLLDDNIKPKTKEEEDLYMRMKELES